MRTQGLTRDQALILWERVSSFTGFSFCKSHSASYAQLSFKCAYLKVHYPAQFLSAVISNNHGFYSRDVYLNEARRWGIRILPMSINESATRYYGKHNWMRPGFMHIRGLGVKSLERIERERARSGKFRNLADFVERTPLGMKEIESLILTGAFDGFGLTQPESLLLLADIHKKLRAAQPRLFEESGMPASAHAGLTDYSLARRCFNELRLLGFMLSGDILDILDLHPAAKGSVAADALHCYVGKRVKVFGWMITNRVHMVDAKRPMMFITVEDKTESVDVVLWPDVYERYADELAEPGPFEIWGTVSEDWDACTLEARRIAAVQWSPGVVDFERASKRLEQSFTKNYIYADIPKTSAA